MLQRSPTYIFAAPGTDAVANRLRKLLSPKAAYAVTRWKNVVRGMAFYGYCRRFPEQAKKFMVGHMRQQLPGYRKFREDFVPSYNPWDQRVCLVPDGDLFQTLLAERASVVTDHIETFTETGIKLRSGAELEADIVVTATGLNLKVLGGLQLNVDGRSVEMAKTMTYKGMMLSDVPNMAYAIGYTNASWTLKCDLTAEYVCRLIKHMDKVGASQCCPRHDPSVPEESMMSFNSGYVLRAIEQFPRQGTRAPWRLYQNYMRDRRMLRHAPLVDSAMEFRAR
jgi:cation diffusion facilitator CzcD-associated flavoprotein CzcO